MKVSKLHPTFRDKHTTTTTLRYNDSVPFRTAWNTIQGLTVDVPDLDTSASFKYRISKATKDPRRKLTPLFG
jgi:hypothetical protein